MRKPKLDTRTLKVIRKAVWSIWAVSRSAERELGMVLDILDLELKKARALSPKRPTKARKASE